MMSNLLNVMTQKETKEYTFLNESFKPSSSKRWILNRLMLKFQVTTFLYIIEEILIIFFYF